MWGPSNFSMPQTNPPFECHMFRMESVAFLAGLVIFVVSTMLHPSREDPIKHPPASAEYVKDDV